MGFGAMVGVQPFICGQTYDNLGANDTSLSLTDFRFYVQDLRLKNSQGNYVPVELAQSDFQVNNVALLDFEDGCGAMGNEPMNSLVIGTVPSGTYTGIRFEMGVPFEMNHVNPATAPPPMNLTSLFWNWQGGYKFLRTDSGAFGDADWRMHLGSTGCDGDELTGGTTMCANPNRVNVELDGFDPETNTVVADFAALVDGAALDENQPETPFGCMSVPADLDCAPIFENLGLPFAGSDPPAQSFFSME